MFGFFVFVFGNVCIGVCLLDKKLGLFKIIVIGIDIVMKNGIIIVFGVREGNECMVIWNWYFMNNGLVVIGLILFNWIFELVIRESCNLRL